MNRSARHLAAFAALATSSLGVASPALAARATASASTQSSASPVPTSGGAALSPTTNGLSGSPSAPADAGNPIVQPGNVTVSADGAGISFSTTASALLSKGLTFTGTVPANDAGQVVEIERLGHETDWAWAPTVQGTVSSTGAFTATWNTNHIGQFSMRAVLETAASTARAGTAHIAAASPTLTITVYRPSIATWYGPGFFGKQTACGIKLTRQTVGVANRTLPCGTQVALYYKGQTTVVPVIDRGPYSNNADWDLSQATSRALGIDETVTLGAVSLPKPSGTTGAAGTTT